MVLVADADVLLRRRPLLLRRDAARVPGRPRDVGRRARRRSPSSPTRSCPATARSAARPRCASCRRYLRGCVAAQRRRRAIPPGPWDTWLERDRDAINIERAALLAPRRRRMPPVDAQGDRPRADRPSRRTRWHAPATGSSGVISRSRWRRTPTRTSSSTSTKGVTRTLDDWSTMFHLCLVILPPRPRRRRYIPIAERIFKVFGDADCRTAFCVVGNEFIARGVLGDAEDAVPLRSSTPTRELVTSLGLTHLPAFVHLRQDTTLVAAAEGWDPPRGRRVAKEVGKAMAWSVPTVAAAGDPPPDPRLAGLNRFVSRSSTQRQHGPRTAPDAGEGQYGFARVPRVRTGVHPCADVLLLDVCVCCAQRRVQQGPKRPGRRSPHMNRRALRLVITRPVRRARSG